MTGAFLNALGILLGALFGLAQRAPLSLRTQDYFRRALGAFTVFFGLRLVWLGVNGTFGSCAKTAFHRAARRDARQLARQAAAPAKNLQPPRPLSPET